MTDLAAPVEALAHPLLRRLADAQARASLSPRPYRAVGRLRAATTWTSSSPASRLRRSGWPWIKRSGSGRATTCRALAPIPHELEGLLRRPRAGSSLSTTTWRLWLLAGV